MTKKIETEVCGSICYNDRRVGDRLDYFTNIFEAALVEGWDAKLEAVGREQFINDKAALEWLDMMLAKARATEE